VIATTEHKRYTVVVIGPMILFQERDQSSNFVMKKIVFKIAAASEWSKAMASGLYEGSADDYRDGFIHLSSQEQIRGTLEKHFRGKGDLLLIAFEASELGPELKWEQSRGGDLFPHLYGKISVSKVLWQRALRSDENGMPQIDEEWFAC
jgi:uncharacterized protein (DUF952 family)